MIQHDIGKRIKQRRLELNLSQEQLALAADVTTTYLGQVERAERNPTVGFLEKVADALDVAVVYFFEANTENHRISLENRILHSLHDLTENQLQTVAQMIELLAKEFRETENRNEKSL